MCAPTFSPRAARRRAGTALSPSLSLPFSVFEIRRSRRTSHRTLNPAQGLERGRNEGEVNLEGHDVYTGMNYSLSIVGM